MIWSKKNRQNCPERESKTKIMVKNSLLNWQSRLNEKVRYVDAMMMLMVATARKSNHSYKLCNRCDAQCVNVGFFLFCSFNRQHKRFSNIDNWKRWWNDTKQRLNICIFSSIMTMIFMKMFDRIEDVFRSFLMIFGRCCYSSNHCHCSLNTPSTEHLRNFE